MEKKKNKVTDAFNALPLSLFKFLNLFAYASASFGGAGGAAGTAELPGRGPPGIAEVHGGGGGLVAGRSRLRRLLSGLPLWIQGLELWLFPETHGMPSGWGQGIVYLTTLRRSWQSRASAISAFPLNHYPSHWEIVHSPWSWSLVSLSTSFD